MMRCFIVELGEFTLNAHGKKKKPVRGDQAGCGRESERDGTEAAGEE